MSVRGNRKVGMLGSQSREKALACLQSCPLLADLAEWSHWDLVFRPEHGDLKEFVQRFGKLHNSTVTGEWKAMFNLGFLSSKLAIFFNNLDVDKLDINAAYGHQNMSYFNI